MEHYAGIDVSLEQSSVCVVDVTGRIVREAKVASEPAALIAWFDDLGVPLARVGLEAGPLSQWLHAALRETGSAVELLETRHVRAAFKAMPVKTDRKDARGIAQLMRLGWFRPVHCKSPAAQEVRALLTARKLVQSKLHDLEMSLRGILRGLGLKVGATSPRRFGARIRELAAGHPTLAVVTDALLAARTVRPDLCRGDRRSRAVQPGEGGRGAFRADPEEVPIRREGRDGADFQDRRRRRPSGSLRSGQRHPDPTGQRFGAQELGDAAGKPRREAQGEGGLGAQACRDPPPHAG